MCPTSLYEVTNTDLKNKHRTPLCQAARKLDIIIKPDVDPPTRWTAYVFENNI